MRTASPGLPSRIEITNRPASDSADGHAGRKNRAFSITSFCRKSLLGLLGTIIMPAALAARIGITGDKIVVIPVELAAADKVAWSEKTHQTFDGKKIEADASMTLWKCSDITISCCDLRSIEISECERVTLRNCWIHDSSKIGVSVYKSKDVRIEGCRFENVVTGLFAAESQHLQFVGNFCRNVKGPFPRGQMVQFDNVTGTGNLIQGNYAINEKGQSHPEDVINLFQSRGEEGSPIIVEDNYLVGDPKLGSEGKSKSGSGIMMADVGGAWEVCRRNVILSAGQCGIGVAGGSHIRVEDNRIQGLKSTVSNVGLYIWNQSGKPSDHVTLTRNRVQWTTHDDEDNSWWDGGGITEVEQSDNQFADASLAADLPPPPSLAPMPPHPWTTPGPDGTQVARLPWKAEQK